MNFTIQKKSEKSNARLGVLETSHGTIETPAFVPVATRASVKSLTSEEAFRAGAQLLICNTFHLHARPGEKIIKNAGGLHKFMNWPAPLMTDSGGFQVFSWGFGQDLNTNKIIKDGEDKADVVSSGQQPKRLKITDEGVLFRSGIDGDEVFLNPKISMQIQQDLGADIIFAFDECPPPSANNAYLEKSLNRTHLWAKESLDAKSSDQALFGIVQGGHFKDLRIKSAREIAALPFDGFGLGGEFGADKSAMAETIGWNIAQLPDDKPRHLLGIGHIEDIEPIIKAGVDTFDCIVPTHYARHGAVFTGEGKIDIGKSKYLSSQEPLDASCACATCNSYTKGYLSHLFRAKELTAYKLLSFHNLFFFNQYVASIREKIKTGNF